jgi:prophage regulatory protein
MPDQLSEREQARRRKQRETPPPAYCALVAADDAPSSDTIPSSQKSSGRTRARAPPPPIPGRTFLRLKAVVLKTGLPTSSLYNSIEKGLFPRPVALSERRVGWLLDEVESWMEARIAGRDAGEKSVPVKRRRLHRERGNA